MTKWPTSIRYRDKHADTNVLSFPVDADLQDRTGLLGDLIFCDEVINREAAEQESRESITGRTSRFMACFIYCHDHIDEDDAEIMEALEIQKLDGLAIPNPYNA